ncbi:hypothetical protein Tco_1196629, partial [Tanacetum coccineum]
DALFIGEWSHNNVKSLVAILDCFHKVSGLKINYHKSKLFGVGVSFEEVNSLASITGCNALVSPFNYLGLPIDCNMALIKSWDPICDKFTKRLSKWKASLLSIGGRATLITSVLGAIGTYFFSLFPMPSSVNKKLESLRSNFFWGSDEKSKKISWISWNLALASKDKGGLGSHIWVCPNCDHGIDFAFHTLWVCPLAAAVWTRTFNWLDLSPTVISNLLGLYSWIDGLHMSSSRKDILEVVCGVTLWSLWSFRNEVIFGSVQPIRSMLFDKIVDFSFRWFSSRSKSSSISWNNWIQNPLVVYSL